MQSEETIESMSCRICGIGAWGPGFNNWPELKALLDETENTEELSPQTPKPEIIPANERRRSPLPVKIAVETSWQAVQRSQIPSSDLSCVFGSGLGDTEITDYMCRALTTELKQLSPTKFHNSVHNAAAGYWTISTNCMKAANSIAAYHNTAGLALLEGVSQCIFQNEPLLITLFDTKAHSVYQEIFDCHQPFAAAIVITPSASNSVTTPPTDMCEFSISIKEGRQTHQALKNQRMETLYQQNPAAKILSFLALMSGDDSDATKHLPKQTTLPLSNGTNVSITLNEPCDAQALRASSL